MYVCMCAHVQVPASRLLVIPLDTPTTIDGVTLTFIDANHCPGGVQAKAGAVSVGAGVPG